MIKHIAIASLCALALNASAAVITFDGLADTAQAGGAVQPSTNGPNYTYKAYTYFSGVDGVTVDGFKFSGGALFMMASEYYTYASIPSSYAGNGTDFLMGYNFTMASATKQAFSVDRLDLGWFSTDGSNTVTLTATKVDGTTVNKLLTVTAHNATTTNDFTSFAFTDLKDLKSLQFASTANYIAIDNITVNAVPEPATLALMGLGLAGLVARRRRK